MLRLCVISVMLPLAVGSCLPDAIPAERRQNLVNLNGETYPVGFFISNYAASFAANILGATLVEEILGYNTTVNKDKDTVGSGTVAGYFGVTGCRTPSDVNDRGCMQGVTYFHVHMESWLGIYPSDWEYIQKTYASMAPKDLGSMGYVALSTMYIPKPIQEQAYTSAGRPLQFYRAWNSSWRQPWTYFGTIDSVNKSKLALCTSNVSAMSSDSVMRRHVQMTGDIDGVNITNDTYAARCDDGYWWTPESCRSTPSQCVPWVTGGVGWGLEEFMQKFTIFKMPVAIAVAASFADYSTVPLSGTMSMYWWAPDPTFLDLSPMKVSFPSYKARDWEQGVQTTEASSAVVSTLVSRDLGVLAPIVERFVDNIDLPMSMMDDILLDQKNTTDSWEEVTCRWIKANRATWQNWIPDESACFAGFGLYDSVFNNFTDQRENATNKIVCQACPPGSFSQPLSDNVGSTYICLPCGRGTSQSSGASLSCSACKAGEYQDQEGSQECQRCPIGTYQDEEGKQQCKACPAGTNTLGFGAGAASDCGCPANFIDMDRSGAFNCVECGEGITCPALSQLADLEDGQSANGQAYTPKIQSGYYSTMESPTEVYKCGAVDVYAARCDDGYWWAAPSCRATPSQCVPFLTAGNGWSGEEYMQKFTLFNMPVAIAIAATWGNYTTIPLSGDMAMYWWAPDPTFLDLSPLKVTYPPYKSREWANGVMTSEISGAVVSTIVSRDLGVLAPIVESFVDNIDIPMKEVDDMLLEQKNTGESWENVTCNWIKENRAIWEQWIPDESECFAGFGLYDSVFNNFTDVRVNATNKIVCQACPPGTYSEKLEDNYNSGTTYICVPCGLGTSQSSGASLSCKACKAGEYQDELQSKECKRCPFGTYQEGQTACKTCPASTNTLGFGSVAISDCGCPENSIDMDKTGAYNCVPCGEGLTCPALSSLVDLERGQSDVGEQFTPKIQRGYYATADEPTEIFRCGNVDVCPGGTPGSCAGGLLETPCASCAAGETWTGSVCEDCAGWRQALWVFAIVCIFVFLTMAYYLTTSKVTAKATVLFATTASFGMLVMSMQNLGLIGMMTVEWPDSLQGLFSVCQFLLLDIDSYGFSCVAGHEEPIRYLLSALIFPVGVAWLALGFAVSRLFAKKHHWEGPKVCSTMGAFLQVGFSTMSATSLAPMMCYQHPNGQRSLLKYPGVICGSSDHDLMLVIGSLLLTVFVLGFVALCTFAVMMVPKWSSTHRNHMVAAVRFLVFRFRLDAWWFGVPLLVRGPLINLPVVLATDYPPIQVVVIAMILTTMMVMQMLAWPWKVPMLNLTDCIISFGIVLMVTTSALYLNKIDDTMQAFAQVVSTAMLGGIGVAIGIMVMMTVSALIYRSAMGGKKELKFFNLGSVASSPELAKKVKALADELEKMEQPDLAAKIAALSVFDVETITACITLLATEVAPPAEDGVTFKFKKRIASASFDIALKRKPQSRRDPSLRASASQNKEEEEKEETNDVVMELRETPEIMRSTWI